MTRTLALATVATVALIGAASAQSRSQISIVGSSTVFPFTTAVAETFARGGQFAAPVVESTGTGGGFQLFCSGVGESTADITGASRPMRQSEFDACKANGVADVTEIQIGYDGIVVANSRTSPQLDLTKAQLFQALAKEVEIDGQIVANPYTTWDQIDPAMPAVEIQIFGPPPTSGTRDAWIELVMTPGCNEFEALKALEGDRKTTVCSTMREDGPFIEAGENDNLIVQRLSSEPEAFGIFGYSFLEQNGDVLQGSMIAGVAPTFEAIAAGDYSISRPLFIYVKNAHAAVIPGLREFVAEYTSDRAWGPDGYLADRGLIPLADDERTAVMQSAVSLAPMTAVR